MGNISNGECGRPLFDLQQLNIEDQLRVGGDTREGLSAVGHLGRNRNATLTTDSHAGHTDVPSLDNLALAELEAKRLALLVGCNIKEIVSGRFYLQTPYEYPRGKGNIPSKTLPSSSFPM